MLQNLTTLTFEVQDRVARICLSRPDAANAFNASMASELAAAVKSRDGEEGIRAFVERRPPLFR